MYCLWPRQNIARNKKLKYVDNRNLVINKYGVNSMDIFIMKIKALLDTIQYKLV